jgi:hypothetical protein
LSEFALKTLQILDALADPLDRSGYSLRRRQVSSFAQGETQILNVLDKANALHRIEIELPVT